MEAPLAHREPGGERLTPPTSEEDSTLSSRFTDPPEGEGAGPSGLRRPAAGRLRREEVRQHWRLAAMLFAGGGFGAIPSDALHQPAHPPSVYLLPLLALVSGLACWLLAERNPPKIWLHATAVAATLEVGVTVGLADRIFSIYYVFVAIYAAYVFRDRFAIATQVGFATIAVLAPIVYSPDTTRQTLVEAFALVPTLILAAATVTLLRERLEASERSYRALAECDPLTDVGNYRMLTERLPRELSRHQRSGDSLGLVVVDLDNFKHVNDAFGHQRGDEVLRQVARRLTAIVRTVDIVVRQGGDEFCVVAPGTNPEEAERLARRVEKAIGEIRINGNLLGATTGWAVFPDDAATMEQLMGEADGRLRLAKTETSGLGGRARTE